MESIKNDLTIIGSVSKIGYFQEYQLDGFTITIGNGKDVFIPANEDFIIKSMQSGQLACYKKIQYSMEHGEILYPRKKEVK